MAKILDDKDAKKLAGWLPTQQEKSESEKVSKKSLSEEDIKKIQKIQNDIDKDLIKVLKNLNELYSIKSTKETYDKLVMLETIQRN